MRVVSWNLERRKVACERLWAELEPDFGLVQEISDDEIVRRGGVGRNAARRRFGSAVIGRPGLALTEITSVKPAGMSKPVDRRPSWPGALAAAELTRPDSQSVMLVSVHALFESGWGFRSAHRLVGDPIYLFADRFKPRMRGPRQPAPVIFSPSLFFCSNRPSSFSAPAERSRRDASVTSAGQGNREGGDAISRDDYLGRRGPDMTGNGAADRVLAAGRRAPL